MTPSKDKFGRRYDVIVIGAGAAGMMAAATAGARGRSVWLIDHAKKLGEKIRISGGGRCNFTNIYAAPENYLSRNPHFCKSALKQYTQHDFIALVEKYNIAYHEKKLGQLFCDESAKDIIEMLRSECESNNVQLDMETQITEISKTENGFEIKTSRGDALCESLIIACGGLSIPKIGATPFGYKIAEQFGLRIVTTSAALVPLTFSGAILDMCKSLSGVSVDATVTCGKTTFREGLLFTHRGLSGPSILQISSYWEEGQDIIINLAPDADAYAFLKERKTTNPKQDIETAIAALLPTRLAEALCEHTSIAGRLADLPDKKLQTMAQAINSWHIRPQGTEGYRTAEVTLGGVDTDALSSKTMEAKTVPGLFFIGEVVDVTGHLGGYNFQWAWSSGTVAGMNA